LPAEYVNSSLSQQKQLPTGKSESELKEEEELELAMALSQSEAEAKEMEKKKSAYSSVTVSKTVSPPIVSHIHKILFF